MYVYICVHLSKTKIANFFPRKVFKFFFFVLLLAHMYFHIIYSMTVHMHKTCIKIDYFSFLSINFQHNQLYCVAVWCVLVHVVAEGCVKFCVRVYARVRGLCLVVVGVGSFVCGCVCVFEGWVGVQPCGWCKSLACVCVYVCVWLFVW